MLILVVINIVGWWLKRFKVKLFVGVMMLIMLLDFKLILMNWLMEVVGLVNLVGWEMVFIVIW